MARRYIAPGQATSQAPAPRMDPPTGRNLKTVRTAMGWAPHGRWLATAIAIAASAALPAGARAAEPLCDFLSGVGDAAQALAVGEAPAAAAAARRSAAAAPRGWAAARAAAALGLALEAAARHAEAADALARGVPALAGAARSAALVARAEALLASGRNEEAAAAFHEAVGSGDSALARRAAWREAEALLAARRPAEAAAQLEDLIRTDPAASAAPRGRLALARAMRANGDAQGAAAVLRRLWVEESERPEAAEAASMLDRWRAEGVPVPPANGEDRLARAERLAEAGRPAAALEEVEAVKDSAPPPPAPGRADALRAVALLALGRHAEAEVSARPLAGSPLPEVRRAAELVLARAAARAGRLDEASRRYTAVAARRVPVPGLPAARQKDLADEAAFLSVWLFYDAGKYARAAALLDAFAHAHRRSRRADDARWFAAWSLFRLGRAADAARALARLERGPLAAEALYWEARVADDPARARGLLRQAAAAGAGGWYEVLARARLAAAGEPLPPPPPPVPRPLADLGEGDEADRLRAAADLLALGLRDVALAEISDLARGRRIRPVAAAAAQLAAFAEDADLPFRMARDHLLPTRRALRWSHPVAYPAFLPRARALGVDPALLLAVMRRESSFRADARSAAGAEGLLQLLPRTVDRLEALAGVSSGAAGHLDEPEVSVTAGAWYLGLLLSRFGDPALAVAAYNAGPQPAAQWARDRAGMPLDAWVESVPWRETRQYVKRVMAEYAAYRALEGEAPPPIDPDRRVKPPPEGVDF